MNKQYDKPFEIREVDGAFRFDELYLGGQEKVSFDVPKELLNEGKVRELMNWLQEQRK